MLVNGVIIKKLMMVSAQQSREIGLLYTVCRDVLTLPPIKKSLKFSCHGLMAAPTIHGLYAPASSNPVFLRTAPGLEDSK